MDFLDLISQLEEEALNTNLDQTNTSNADKKPELAHHSVQTPKPLKKQGTDLQIRNTYILTEDDICQLTTDVT